MLRRLLAVAFIVGLLCAAMVPAAAADTKVTNVEVDAPAGTTVGDRFHVVITLLADPGTDVSLAPGAIPDAFSLIDAAPPSVEDIGNSRVRITLDLELAAFQTGDVALPPLTIDYRDAQGAPGQVQTPATSVTIASVLNGATAPTPRGLKPQAEIGSAGAGGLLLRAGVVAVVALLVGAVIFMLVRRRKPKATVADAVLAELGPEDLARAHLDRAAVDFAADRNLVPYYTTIALTVRNYLTERYGFHAFALTTSELRDEMLRRGIDRWQARLVDGLLSQCDAAVYAHYEPAAERADTDLTTAYEVIEMSRPLTEENQEATPVS